MIKVKSIIKLIECAVLTGFLKKEQPISLFLVAEAESGKTSIIKKFRQYDNAFYTNDISFKPIVDYILPRVENGEVSHILIPDFINVKEHKRSAENVIPLLNSLMEEGVEDLKYFGADKSYKEPLHCGLITGVTKRYFDKHIHYWRLTGFLSRMLPITFAYSESTKIEINNSIRAEEYLYEKDHKQLVKRKFDVKIPDELGTQIQLMSEMVCKANSTYVAQYGEVAKKVDLKTYGFRLHTIFRALAKAITIYNSKGKRREFNQEDLNTLTEQINYINFRYTEL